MKACPSCESDKIEFANGDRTGRSEWGWMVCLRCGMRGPCAIGHRKALTAWDAMPRREDARELRAELAFLVSTHSSMVHTLVALAEDGKRSVKRVVDKLRANAVLEKEDT